MESEGAMLNSLDFPTESYPFGQRATLVCAHLTPQHLQHAPERAPHRLPPDRHRSRPPNGSKSAQILHFESLLGCNVGTVTHGDDKGVDTSAACPPRPAACPEVPIRMDSQRAQNSNVYHHNFGSQRLTFLTAIFCSSQLASSLVRCRWFPEALHVFLVVFDVFLVVFVYS